LMTKDCRKNRLYNRARCVSIYFIRMLTKDAFKLINPFFGFTYPTGAQARYAHVAHLYFEDDRYKKEIDELFPMLEEKINLEAQ
jgi:chromosomal replication initiation ATPase DnaA